MIGAEASAGVRSLFRGNAKTAASNLSMRFGSRTGGSVAQAGSLARFGSVARGHSHACANPRVEPEQPPAPPAAVAVAEKTAAEAQKSAGLSIYDVMRQFKLNGTQVCILLYGALTYNHFIQNVMLVTVSEESLGQRWPELEANRVIFNSCIAGQAIARFIGNLYLVPLQDYLGRRMLILVYNVAALVFTVGSAFAPNFRTYTVFRCLAVLVASAAGVSATVYVTELVNPELRSTVNWLNMVMACVGFLYVVGCKWLLEYFDKPVWNWLQLFGFLPSLVAVCLGAVFYLEGPGFTLLFRREGVRGAWRTLERIAGGPEALDRAIFAAASAETHLQHAPAKKHAMLRGEAAEDEIIDHMAEAARAEHLRKPRLVEEAAATAPLNNNEAFKHVVDVRPVFKSWWHLFKNPQTRSDTLALAVVWFGEAFCHWGVMSYCFLFYRTIGFNPNVMNVITYVLQIPGHFMIMHVRAPERQVIGWTTAVVGVITFALALLMTLRRPDEDRPRDALSWLSAVLAVTVALLGCVIWSPIYAFTAQRYMIGVRASAMGLMSGINAIALIAASYLSSVVITPARIHYMLFANFVLRAIVTAVTFLYMKTAIQSRILDFKE